MPSAPSASIAAPGAPTSRSSSSSPSVSWPPATDQPACSQAWETSAAISFNNPSIPASDAFDEAATEVDDGNDSSLPGGGPRARRTAVFRELGAGLRIGDVDDVVGIDMDSAGPPELIPALEVVAILVVDLDAIIVAVTDEQSALRVEF